MSKEKINSKSFGIVLYMDDSSYVGDPDKDKNIHMPHEKDIIIYFLFRNFYELGIGRNNEVDEVIIGHEHGDVNKKCHMQIFIKFNKKLRKMMEPSNFTIENEKYIYMAQRSKTTAKLRNYCKKGGDFFEMYPNKTIKEMLREQNMIDELIDVDDPYDTMLKNDKLNEKQIITIFKNCPITDYKKDFMTNSKKIFENYNHYIKIEVNLPIFCWNFPKHIYNYVEEHFGDNDKKYLTFAKLYTWFKTYCEPEGYFRRKALFLFSLAGGVGKSFFARSLVPEISICNSPYYVYCRGTLDAGEFLKKDKTARLVILDDVNYISNDIEIWKALTVSEPTNIRSPYHNIPWKHSLPCIMLSNNIKTLRYWMETEDLKSRCIFVGIDFYIGPEGTDKEENHIVDRILSEDILEKLEINKNLFRDCKSF